MELDPFRNTGDAGHMPLYFHHEPVVGDLVAVPGRELREFLLRGVAVVGEMVSEEPGVVGQEPHRARERAGS